jgi:hypothetical protein
MHPRKPGKIKLRSQKLHKVGTVSVIRGPGNLSNFEPPVEPVRQKPKHAKPAHPHAR